MLVLKGKYNTAKVFTDNIKETAISQIIQLCNQEFVSNSQIRIMPDVHAGAGCTIGTTLTITDKIVPNLVGVDIGCGMKTINLGKLDIDLVELDKFIHENIPHGFNNHTKYFYEFLKIENLFCKQFLPKNIGEYQKAIGTLGGGNHFIELGVDDFGDKNLIIHTGSRNLGLQIATYYQKLAESKNPMNPKGLSYLSGQDMENYLHDMNIAQQYAQVNRNCIESKITKFLTNNSGYIFPSFDTIHNYIDIHTGILRKGAVSAQKGEKLLIPLNMRDGSVVAIGKGNYDWNFSAPHGAGRILSRSKAKEKITLEEFKESMEGIYTTSVNKNTLDESPMAYKAINEILDNIYDTVDIYSIIVPIYNFKAGE